MRDFGNRVAVKICGVTNEEDALLCAAERVEMIGLNFSPLSLRCVSRETAEKIINTVRASFPHMNFVGVFLDQDLDFVQKITAELALDAVQLHGDEPPDYLRQIRGTFVIKALRVGANFSVSAATNYSCDGILLDTFSANARGGTGETFPWSVVASFGPRVPRLFLAGGLTSENVAAALRATRPFAVDVCSGVERAPGRKDHEKLRQFVATVRAVEKLEPVR